MRVNQSIPNILTPEDKKNLLRTSYYLQSLGADLGTVRTYLDGNTLDTDSFDWKRTRYFDNLYGIEIPHFAIPVLKKILDYVVDNDLLQGPDVENINSEAVEFQIDSDKKEISFNHDYSYYSEGDSEGTQWTEEEYNDESENPIYEMFQLLEGDPEIKPKNGIVHLRYNGSGDSGYIDDFFEEGGSVPGDIEDWCYRQLENQHGGWEINEGSQGVFEFDIKNKTVDLYHTYNTEENKSDTLFEESFA